MEYSNWNIEAYIIGLSIWHLYIKVSKKFGEFLRKALLSKKKKKKRTVTLFQCSVVRLLVSGFQYKTMLYVMFVIFFLLIF